jgi:hypothetical protein
MIETRLAGEPSKDFASWQQQTAGREAISYCPSALLCADSRQ